MDLYPIESNVMQFILKNMDIHKTSNVYRDRLEIRSQDFTSSWRHQYTTHLRFGVDLVGHLKIKEWINESGAILNIPPFRFRSRHRQRRPFCSPRRLPRICPWFQCWPRRADAWSVDSLCLSSRRRPCSVNWKEFIKQYKPMELTSSKYRGAVKIVLIWRRAKNP